jgi:hypothetical protein
VAVAAWGVTEHCSITSTPQSLLAHLLDLEQKLLKMALGVAASSWWTSVTWGHCLFCVIFINDIARPFGGA